VSGSWSGSSANGNRISRSVAKCRSIGELHLEVVLDLESAGRCVLVGPVQTVPSDRHVHSLHGYFLRPGVVDRPIVYEVDPSRDGGTFTTRRVVAIQNGEPIFTLAASFQIVELRTPHEAAVPARVDVSTASGISTSSISKDRVPGLVVRARGRGLQLPVNGEKQRSIV
jgi:hypothetical protein